MQQTQQSKLCASPRQPACQSALPPCSSLKTASADNCSKWHAWDRFFDCSLCSSGRHTPGCARRRGRQQPSGQRLAARRRPLGSQTEGMQPIPWPYHPAAWEAAAFAIFGVQGEQVAAKLVKFVIDRLLHQNPIKACRLTIIVLWPQHGPKSGSWATAGSRAGIAASASRSGSRGCAAADLVLLQSQGHHAELLGSCLLPCAAAQHLLQLPCYCLQPG